MENKLKEGNENSREILEEKLLEFGATPLETKEIIEDSFSIFGKFFNLPKRVFSLLKEYRMKENEEVAEDSVAKYIEGSIYGIFSAKYSSPFFYSRL
jgi:hypothetical protein